MRKTWLLLFLALVFFEGCGENTGPAPSKAPAPTLSAEHYSAIRAAFKSKQYPDPSSLKINESGWLETTFVLKNPRSEAYLESFATEALLTIRNTMLPYSIVNKYSVILDGPSPGPGLVLRYGTARFIEGGKLEWKPTRK